MNPTAEAPPVDAHPSLPSGFSYSSLSTYAACPLRYRFAYVERIPGPDRPRAPLAFGSMAHAAFEAFTLERRERAMRGEPAPGREDIDRLFLAHWDPEQFESAETGAAFEARVGGLVDGFWAGEEARDGETIAEELGFELAIPASDGAEPVRLHGVIDRIDRLPSGGVEVIDYKTGRPWIAEPLADNLQLTIYALACRDALGLGTPERVTLDFPEVPLRLSTVRTDVELDEARSTLATRVLPIRAGDFGATPGGACRWCDYAGICPERA
jgi:RecB family exonuclease